MANTVLLRAHPTNTMALGADAIKQEPLVNVDISTPEDDTAIPEVPPKYLHGTNLNSAMVSYHDRRKEVKNKKAALLIEREIQNILKYFDPEKDKYNVQLIRDIMSC